MGKRVQILNMQSPGDVIVLTATVRDISLAYPGRFDFTLKTSTPDVWKHNPFIKSFPSKAPGTINIKANYPLIHRSNQDKGRPHFIWGFLEDMNRKLNVNAPLTELRPALYLAEEEKKDPPFEPPYWVMVAGGKKDYTAKWWLPSRWQTVADGLCDRRRIIQVGSGGHVHPRLKNVTDLVGKTTMRDLFRLIYHSEGVLCIVTCLVHIAAAFNKPCVCVAGGREPWWWEEYSPRTREINLNRGKQNWTPIDDGYVEQKYLHTINKLPCCRNKGCWKSHVGSEKRSPCIRQVKIDGTAIPECLDMISPEQVIAAVESYFPDGLTKDTPILQTAVYEPPQPDWTAGNLITIDPNKKQPEIPVDEKGEWETKRPDIIIHAPDGSKQAEEALSRLRKHAPKDVRWIVICGGDEFKADGVVVHGYTGEQRISAVMKSAFDLVERDWVVWLNADAVPMYDDWFTRLAREVRDRDLLGWLYWMEPTTAQLDKIKQQSWYKNIPFAAAPSKKGGVRLYYPSGEFFAVRRKVLQKIGEFPANGSDDFVLFGAALRQTGARLRNVSALFETA